MKADIVKFLLPTIKISEPYYFVENHKIQLEFIEIEIENIGSYYRFAVDIFNNYNGFMLVLLTQPQRNYIDINLLLNKINDINYNSTFSLTESRLVIYALNSKNPFLGKSNFVKYGILFNLNKYFKEEYGYV